MLGYIAEGNIEIPILYMVQYLDNHCRPNYSTLDERNKALRAMERLRVYCRMETYGSIGLHPFIMWIQHSAWHMANSRFAFWNFLEFSKRDFSIQVG